VTKFKFEISLLILRPVFGSIASVSQMTMKTDRIEIVLVKGAASKAMPILIRRPSVYHCSEVLITPSCSGLNCNLFDGDNLIGTAIDIRRY
jgi:hypothetical protein